MTGEKKDSYYWFLASCYWRLSRRAEEASLRPHFRNELVRTIRQQREMDQAFLDDFMMRLYLRSKAFYAMTDVSEVFDGTQTH